MLVLLSHRYTGLPNVDSDIIEIITYSMDKSARTPRDIVQDSQLVDVQV
jgi:hypothetical protein